MKFDIKSQRVHLLRKIDHKDFVAKVLLSTGLIFLVASGLLGITADLMTPDLDWNPIVNSIQIAFLSFALFLDSIGLLLYINILFLRKKVKNEILRKWNNNSLIQWNQ